jgi:hypothetical protein
MVSQPPRLAGRRAPSRSPVPAQGTGPTFCRQGEVDWAMTTGVGWLGSKGRVHENRRNGIEGTTVYVAGYRTLHEQNRNVVIRLPTSTNSQPVSVFWINPDGTRVAVPIAQ